MFVFRALHQLPFSPRSQKARFIRNRTGNPTAACRRKAEIGGNPHHDFRLSVSENQHSLAGELLTMKAVSLISCLSKNGRAKHDRCCQKCPTQGRQNYSAGNTASTPFFFTKTTTNFAGLVVLALRPIVCTSLGPS